MTGCPMTMTDGAATLVAKSLREMEEGGQSAPAEESEEERRVKRDVFMEAYRRLTSDRPSESWTSGQWMTERSGGSDVRGTETVARRLTGEELQAEKQGRGRPQLDASGRPLGPWRIDGFKWFSSATDSDMTMLLAQTGKGLSAFMVPMRRQSSTGRGETELNGIRIQRLKNKMGTKAVPTAELELVGSRGWLVGEEGKGVKQISVILNITRLHTAMGSISYWSRGLAVCRAYSKIRRIRGSTLLTDNSQHVAWMAGETVKYWACTQLTFFGAALMGCVEQGRQVMNVTPAGASSGLIPQDPSHIADLLRLLTPVIKAQVSMAAVSGLRSCMECLGGVGYCENHEDGGILNIAKLFRDSVVNTIWEGTGSVMADDVGRVLRDKRIAGGRIIEDVFARWVRTCLSAQDSGDREAFKLETLVVDERLEVLLGLVAAVKKDPGELEYRGRDLLEHLEVLTSAVVLLWDAQTDKDEVAGHIATQYVWSRVVVAQSCYARPSSDWKTSAAIDRMIFLGSGYSSPSKSAREKL
ncbi:uncharacterized protein B0I36DRAFT_316927 [Microdochium trichocladiopsis]|uniref:Uncharacterized protein n=1 Tax=Microdochium trichocladiopsis TaxID=1682393 RepID=A0A9P8YA78_9PEZI|nr:uncharacterized protein B0I36DRAFT_316927 [Microdochium trichocladiopsis]KAH7034778.1 hypothetical protein B0I36DRAFT_316927 [Microdochium trichocladiopsis]